MKYQIVIADDERNIREGIAELVDWAELDCEIKGCFANGEGVLRFLEQSGEDIDIVVTDIKMPILDGLELLSVINNKYPNILVILLTAFSDFQYARQALKNNAFDFVIKNDFITELPDSVRRAIDKIEKQALHRQKEAGAESFNQQLLRFIPHIMQGVEPVNEELEFLQFTQYSYCICSCETTYYDDIANRQEQIHKLKNFLLTAMKGWECLIHVQDLHHYVMIFRYRQCDSEAYTTLVKQLNKVLTMIDGFMRLDMRIGISSEISSPKELMTGYDHSLRALAGLKERGCGLMVYHLIPADEKEIQPTDIDEYIQQFQTVIAAGDKDAMELLMESLKQELARCGRSFEQCKLDTLLIGAALIRRLNDYDHEGIVDEAEQKLYREIQEAKTLFRLIEACKSAAGLVMHERDLCQINKNGLVKRVDTIIAERYRENLTLQELSSELFVNRSYLGRVYKKQTGKTVSDAINIMRVKKARQLLGDNRYRVYEVGALVGIEDPGYFTRVFLKYMGCTPTEYRNQN